MKLFFLLAALLAGGLCGAQPPALQAMLASERSFAAQSVRENTRDAFLAFMDTGAIVFRKDSFVNAYQLWLAREKRPGLLDWKPVLAEVAASGDWGFSTGPWTFRPTEKDSVTARGHFFTIWHKNADGQWKFLFDNGIDGGKEPLQVLYPFDAAKTPGDTASLFAADRDFNQLLQADPATAHRRYLSATSLLCRAHGSYAVTPGQQAQWLKGLRQGVSFLPSGYLLSPSRDLALVYGTISGEHPDAALRLWRHEPGGWRLAAELLPL